MIKIIKTEFIKSKRAMTNKFIIITPLLSVLLSLLWGGGQNGAYNWWYVMFLPGMLAIVASQIIVREKEHSYKSILLYPYDKGMIWLGKIAYISILLVITSIILMIGIELISLIYLPTISLKANMLATLILILTFLFYIPISMFLTVKFNMFVSVLFSIGMTVVGVVGHSSTNSLIFKLFPYSISSGLMAPILKILPNGLPVPENSTLLDRGMILGDTILSLIVFLILTALTTLWFRKKEVN